MRKIFIYLFAIAATGLLLLSCTKKDSTPAPVNPNNDPRAGSRWLYQLTWDQTFSTAPPNHFEFDIEWTARDTTISGEKWLSITEKNFSSGGTATLFAIRRGNGGWRCKLLNTPKEGLWLVSSLVAGGFYNQTHPVGMNGVGFAPLNYDVSTQILDVANFTTTGGVVYQGAVNAAFDEYTNSGNIHQVQGTRYQTDGPLMIKNSVTYTNAAAGLEDKQAMELKSFTR